MGAYMRCFWQPVATAAELAAQPVLPVRLLGERLALYRAEDGNLGLVAERCAHRGASLACGMVEGNALVCAYHGWKYDATGACIATPAESRGSTLRERVRIGGYPVQELAGMIWAYLGPAPAPLLPRYEHLVRDDWQIDIGITRLPCNWLQISENTLDPLHVEHLHLRYTEWVRRKKGLPPIEKLARRHHVKLQYDLFEYGIIKRRLWEGDTEEAEEWRIGHPQIFPAIALIAFHDKWVQYQFRVPQDDTNTLHYWVNARACEPGVPKPADVPIWENPWQTPEGGFIPEVLNAQDAMVWVTQGAITNHAAEHLAESDRGVVLYRTTLLEQAARVEQGLDPLGVVRDPAKNTPWLQLPLERHFTYSLSGLPSSVAYDFPEREVVPTS